MGLPHGTNDDLVLPLTLLVLPIRYLHSSLDTRPTTSLQLPEQNSRGRTRATLTTLTMSSLSRQDAESQVRSWGFSTVYTWTDGP